MAHFLLLVADGGAHFDFFGVILSSENDHREPSRTAHAYCEGQLDVRGPAWAGFQRDIGGRRITQGGEKIVQGLVYVFRRHNRQMMRGQKTGLNRLAAPAGTDRNCRSRLSRRRLHPHRPKLTHSLEHFCPGAIGLLSSHRLQQGKKIDSLSARIGPRTLFSSS